MSEIYQAPEADKNKIEVGGQTFYVSCDDNVLSGQSNEAKTTYSNENSENDKNKKVSKNTKRALVAGGLTLGLVLGGAFAINNASKPDKNKPSRNAITPNVSTSEEVESTTQKKATTNRQSQTTTITEAITTSETTEAVTDDNEDPNAPLYTGPGSQYIEALQEGPLSDNGYAVIHTASNEAPLPEDLKTAAWSCLEILNKKRDLGLKLMDFVYSENDGGWSIKCEVVKDRYDMGGEVIIHKGEIVVLPVISILGDDLFE
ncbi:MAG: hypothetical protein LBM09_02115 [Candidatus Nomurabacteria bacterium]|nr:hypothetical protein [Candidatus Nomurabacteria bacterium]